MTINKKQPLPSKDIARRLDQSGLPWAVFAGAATAAYSAGRPINDLDILIPKAMGPQAAALFPEARLEYYPGGAVWEICLPGCDILAGLEQIELDGEMQKRANRMAIDGITMPVIPPEDNIVFKALLGRGPEQGKRDWQDVAEILVNTGDQLDWNYLHSRASQYIPAERLAKVLAKIELLAKQAVIHFEGPLGVISDIHGNFWALEAILEDIQRRSVRQVVNLGDSLYGPLAPAETAKLLLAHDFPTVSGNEDRLILESLQGCKRSATLEYVTNQLAQIHLDWLAGQEMTTVYERDFFLCHGTPQQDDHYLMLEITPSGIIEKSKRKLANELSAIPQPLILCGHDHTPRAIRLPNGAQIINPGSVGLPAYTDDLPYPHAMQIGSPHARYSILEFDERGWRAYNYAVRYDWQAAAVRALKNMRPDWAHWIKTGLAG